MRYIVSASLVLVGLLHLLPVTGVLGVERLATLYGVHVGDPSTEILMRHRAVLFALLGAAMLAAAFTPAWQPLALLAGVASVLSFLVLAWWVPGYSPQVARVVAADAVALVLLVLGSAAWVLSKPPDG